MVMIPPVMMPVVMKTVVVMVVTVVAMVVRRTVIVPAMVAVMHGIPRLLPQIRTHTPDCNAMRRGKAVVPSSKPVVADAADPTADVLRTAGFAPRPGSH